MKNTIKILFVAISLALVAGCVTKKSQAELQAKAKITEAQARETALAKAPGGNVKTCELEEEKGKLVSLIHIRWWSPFLFFAGFLLGWKALFRYT